MVFAFAIDPTSIFLAGLKPKHIVSRLLREYAPQSRIEIIVLKLSKPAGLHGQKTEGLLAFAEFGSAFDERIVHVLRRHTSDVVLGLKPCDREPSGVDAVYNNGRPISSIRNSPYIVNWDFRFFILDVLVDAWKAIREQHQGFAPGHVLHCLSHVAHGAERTDGKSTL